MVVSCVYLSFVSLRTRLIDFAEARTFSVSRKGEVMVSFRLHYVEWITNLNDVSGQGPMFRIYIGASDAPSAIWVYLPGLEFRTLQNEVVLQQETRIPTNLHKAAVVRFAITRLTQALKDGHFLEPPTRNTLTLPLEAADLPAIRQLLQEKTCAYQLRQGRDLFCSAASADDPTRRGHTGLQTLAPTSRDVCQVCALPDTDYVCAHLLHPEVAGRANKGGLYARQLQGALCDLGKREIDRPTLCRAGGHDCWEWLVEPELDRPAISVSPLTLPEAFDFLDVCWRLAFGKKQRLVRLNNLAGAAMLSLPCATRDELSTRLSALVDTLNSLDIPDTLLPEPSNVEDGTLNRLQACLKGRLDEAEHPACEHAITVLRAVNRLRVSFQHSATTSNLPVVCAQLSLPFPLPPPGDTWERIRVTVTEALEVIREAIRRYAESDRDAT
jgi:hypothetical protein